MTVTANLMTTISRRRQRDIATVPAIFERLSERSRRLRFGDVQPMLTPRDLELLTPVDTRRRRARRLRGQCARRTRTPGPPRQRSASAEVGVAVTENFQGFGIGTALVRELAIDARAAGITHPHAWIDLENRASRSLMRAQTTIVQTRYDRGTLHIVGQLGAPHRGTR